MRKYISIKKFRKNPEKFTEQDKVWLCTKQKLSEKFMKEMKDHLIWSLISAWQNLREDFIIEMKDYVDWNMISSNQDLTEEFMDKYTDLLNWQEISDKQEFSEEFAWRHIEDLDTELLIRSFTGKKLSESFYRALFHHFWNKQKGNCKFLIYPSFCSPSFSMNFIREFKHMFNYEVMDFFKSKKKNRKEAEKLFFELKDRIDEKAEWNFFVLKFSPSINFLQRWKENYFPKLSIKRENYSKKDNKIIEKLIEECEEKKK